MPKVILNGKNKGFARFLQEAIGENGGAPPPSKNQGACRPNAFMHLRQPLYCFIYKARSTTFTPFDLA